MPNTSNPAIRSKCQDYSTLGEVLNFGDKKIRQDAKSERILNQVRACRHHTTKLGAKQKGDFLSVHLSSSLL